MPKSKRAKVITLSRTQPKGRSGKSKQIEKLQSFVEDYKTILIFSVANMRTNIFQKIRTDLRDSSKFYMGKKSLVRLAFGKDAEESYIPGLYRVALDLEKRTESEVGLLFTNNLKEVRKVISESVEPEFARGGFLPSTTITKEPGVLEEFPTSMFEHLRTLLIPVHISNGKIHLLEKFDLCKKNEKLTPEKAELLKLFGIKLAEFKVLLQAKFSDGVLKELKK